MKIDLENKKTRFCIGVFLVVLSILIMAVSAVIFFQGKDKPPQQYEQKSSITKEEREAILAEAVQDTSGEEEVQSEEAQKIMNLDVHIPDELCEFYLNGDRERLYQEIETFLIENDFYTDVEQAVCTQIVTKNHKKNVSYLEFNLDNPARTILTLEYDGARQRYKFNYR